MEVDDDVPKSITQNEEDLNKVKNTLVFNNDLDGEDLEVREFTQALVTTDGDIRNTFRRKKS